MMPRRIGLIGCGRAGVQLHLPALAAVPGARVTALADVDPARLAAAQRLVPHAAAHQDYRRLLDDASVDVVAVCVPPALHAPAAIGALQADKDVLVEKPLAHTLEAADRIVAAARSTSRTAGVGHQLRCHRLVVQARAVLSEGGLGRIVAARSAWTTDLRHPAGSWQRAGGQGGSLICDIGLHHLDLFQFLLRRRVLEISARVEEDDDGGGRAAVTAMLEGGVLATSLFARGTAPRNELELYGDKGGLRVDCYRFDGLERGGPRRDIAARMRGGLDTALGLVGAVGRLRRGGDYVDAYRRHWLAFLAAVRGEGRVPCTPEEGRDALAAAQAAEASARSGGTVRVAPASFVASASAAGE